MRSSFSPKCAVRDHWRLKAGLGVHLATTLGTLVALFTLFVSETSAQRIGLRPEIEATFHLKVLSFDKRLLRRTDGEVVLGVLFDPNSDDSKKSGAQILKAFRRLAKNIKVRGRTLKIVPIAYAETSLAQDLKNTKIGILYVTPAMIAQVDVIARTTAALEIPTLTGHRSLVMAGLAVGVVSKGGRPKMVVNIAAAKASGMQLDARFLRMAELIR